MIYSVWVLFNIQSIGSVSVLMGIMFIGYRHVACTYLDYVPCCDISYRLLATCYSNHPPSGLSHLDYQY